MKNVGDKKGHSLGYNVFKELEKDILDGKIPSGESLTELKLSNELGVSRTPVREAIIQLEQEGLVKITPNKGAVVLGVTNKDIEDIYTIRSYIEGLASKWAAEKISDEEIQRLQETTDLMEFYISKNSSDNVRDLDYRFHHMIYEFSRSRILEHTLSNYHHIIQRYRQLSFITGDRAIKSIEEHRLILNAIAQRDGEAAEKYTIDHIINAKINTQSAIKNSIK